MNWFYIFLPLALPLYLIRFQILGLPSTLLEVYIGILLLHFTFVFGWNGWRMAWQRVGTWRYALIGWIVATAVAVIVSPSIWSGMGLWRAYVLEPILVFITLFVALEKEDVRQKMIYSLFSVCWIVVTWAVVQFVTGKGIPHPWNVAIDAGRRATGPYPFPNALALFVTPIAAFAFGEWIRRPQAYFALATVIISLVGILLVKSDGGLVALGVVVALMLATKRWGRWIVAGGIVAGTIGLVLFPDVRSMIWNELTFNGWSGKVRLIMWRETWTMLKDHWFFGAGFGGYPVVFDTYHKTRFIEIFQYPHNILLNFWSETGLLGMVAFVGVVGAWVGNPPLVKGGVGGVAPLLAIFIHGLVDVPYFKNDLAMAFWILAFLAQQRFYASEDTSEVLSDRP